MRVNRRNLLGGLGVMGMGAAVSGEITLAQEATPVAVGSSSPGYAIARYRSLPSGALNQAIYPDVMARFLPPTTAVPGFFGYVFAFDEADPGGSLTLTMLDDAAGVEAANDVASAYVQQLDPRFSVETPLVEDGTVRIYASANAAPDALPPFLHGTWFTMRHYTDAEDAEEAIEASISRASETLLPVLSNLPGFVLYCVIRAEGARAAVNIWESVEQLRAGDEAVAQWRDEGNQQQTVGQTSERNGPVAYARIAASPLE